METTNNENEELKKIAPTLFNIEKKGVFETPEHYFEKLPGLMQDKVHANIKPKNYWVPDYKFALAMASILLLIFAGFEFFNGPKQLDTEIATTEFVQNYDAQYLAAADEVELADELDDVSLEITSNQIEQNSGLSEIEIEDYLINNNIDITTLTNEF